jgi:hypothetical protein
MIMLILITSKKVRLKIISTPHIYMCPTTKKKAGRPKKLQPRICFRTPGPVRRTVCFNGKTTRPKPGKTRGRPKGAKSKDPYAHEGAKHVPRKKS